jgi:hypothetical protein
MKLNTLVPMLLGGFCRQTAGQQSEFALINNLKDAESHYWLGMAYQALAHIGQWPEYADRVGAWQHVRPLRRLKIS